MMKLPSNVLENVVLHPLVAKGVLRKADLEAGLDAARSSKADIESVLLDKFRIPKDELGKILSDYYGCPYVPYDGRTIPDPDLLKDLSSDYLRKNHWLPLRRRNMVLDVLIDNPHDIERGVDIKQVFPGMTIRFSVSLRRDIERFLLHAIGQTETGSIADTLGELVNEAHTEQLAEAKEGGVDENDSAIVRLANQIIAEAYRLSASDIHIEPYSDRKDTIVRFRVDGTCFSYMKIPASYRRAIVSRLKIMANLDISERRKPQDGKIRYKLNKDSEIELRVATLPTAGYNEDVVLRLLTAKQPMPLEAMELAPVTLQTVKELANHPHGMILCVGPTGSGKTTLLHAILQYLNTDERKIWTAEDPVEITQEGLRQVQVQPKIGFTFAVALRSFLRADPDVIMIGEMRDKETADVAIEASLTGHLVLSTLHTNSAVETIVRLLDMGCDSFNFADSILGVVALRLCKRICLECRETYHPTRQEYDELVQVGGPSYWVRFGLEYNNQFQLFRGRGCEACNHTGFKGRVALHELLRGTEEMKGMIQARTRTAELLKLATREGMTTLVQNGVEKVLLGVTTLKQVRMVAVK